MVAMFSPEKAQVLRLVQRAWHDVMVGQNAPSSDVIGGVFFRRVGGLFFCAFLAIAPATNQIMGGAGNRWMWIFLNNGCVVRIGPRRAIAAVIRSARKSIQSASGRLPAARSK